MHIKEKVFEIYTNKDIKQDLVLINLPDIHFCQQMNPIELKILKENLTLIKPNAIFLSGDTIDSVDEIQNELNKNLIYNFLEQIALIAPTFMSLDWHDYLTMKDKSTKGNSHSSEWIGDYYRWVNAIENIQNFTVLKPEDKEIIGLTYNIDIVGHSINPNLITKRSYTDIKIVYLQALQNWYKQLSINFKHFNIMLYHNPQPFYNESGLMSSSELGIKGIDLILSGHLHAGMRPDMLEIFEKIIKIGLINPEKNTLLPKYVEGLFQNEDLINIISRGYTKMPYTAGDLMYKVANKVYSKRNYDVITLKKV